MPRSKAALPEVFKASANTDNTACLLTRDLRMVKTNAAWHLFADANGADPAHPTWRPGESILDAIPEPLRPFYEKGFASALETNTPWAHDYDCSTPDQYRTFRMFVYPQGEFLVVTHAPHSARPHDREICPPSDRYRRNGVITMCCHCHCVRAPESPQRWDWVPAWIADQPANVSHGLCPPCLEYHYPDDGGG